MELVRGNGADERNLLNPTATFPGTLFKDGHKSTSCIAQRNVTIQGGSGLGDISLVGSGLCFIKRNTQVMSLSKMNEAGIMTVKGPNKRQDE